MSRPGTNSSSRFFFGIIFLFLFFQSSCSKAQVLGIPVDEAAKILNKGDIGFINQAELPELFPQAASQLKQLLAIHSGAPFYAALQAGEIRRLSGNPGFYQYDPHQLEILLFCAALGSPSSVVRREAVLKLIPLVLEEHGTQRAQNILDFLDSFSQSGSLEYIPALRAACLYRLGRFEEITRLFPANSTPENQSSGWERAFELFAALSTKTAENAEPLMRDITALLFDSLSGAPLRWANREALSFFELFDETENAALRARLNPANNRLALSFMRQALYDGGSIFFRYPDLLRDLARAYQFTPAMREEGLALFRSWGRLLESGEALEFPSSLADIDGPGDYQRLRELIHGFDREALEAQKYLIYFFIGRMERASGRFADSLEYFQRALEFAPNALQADATMSYMLTNALAIDQNTAVSVAVSTIPRWNSMPFFTAFMDRLASALTSSRQWENLYEVFLQLEKRGPSASRAQYAWIVGRAVEEGFLQRAAGSAESYFRISFEDERGSFYYRTMAASRLGENFSPLSGNTRQGIIPRRARQNETPGPEAEFILGFFRYGASAFVLPYLRAAEAELTIPELRKIAEVFASNGRIRDSLSLMTRFTQRPDFEFTRQDLYMFFPRPFRELIEKYAAEMGIKPEVLFALIRTESFFDHNAVSRSNAVGLAQLMPATADEMAGRIARQGGPDYRQVSEANPRGIDLRDPQINVHLGSFYLRRLNEVMGDPMLALLAYNGGMGRVRRWLAADLQQGALPLDLFRVTVEYPETRNYGRLVLGAAAIYGYLYYGRTMEEVAREIYRALF